MHFRENFLHTGQDLIIFPEGIDTITALRNFRSCKFQPLNPDHNIFQGMRFQTDLGMNHICVYNDKLVLMHGKQLIVDLELAFAADDIKQLRIAMGMGDGKPISAVPGGGNIAQLHFIMWERIIRLFKGVVNMAHCGTSFLSIYCYRNILYCTSL